jgi:flagellar biogenesis protein FliO
MDVVRQVLSVLLVFALLGAALWKLRRGGAAVFRIPWNRASKKDRSIEQVEKLVLTPQHTLHLIRVEGREMVVATHPQGCTVISCAGMELRAELGAERGAGA